MRIMNLMIVLAVISIIILVAQYVSQLRKNRSGNNFVSGGRVFFNWVLAIVFVVCVIGIGFESFYGGHKEEAKTDNTENVEYTPSADSASSEVTLQFDKKVKLDDNGEAKVKFFVSPDTKLTIRGHKTQEDVKVFKASKKTKHSYTFDVAGTYDIIAQRGSKKVTKKLKVKANDDVSSSSSSVASSSSTSSSSSSSSSVASSSSSNANNARSQNNSTRTSRAANNGGSYGGVHVQTQQSSSTSTSENNAGGSGYHRVDDGPGAPAY